MQKIVRPTVKEIIDDLESSNTDPLIRAIFGPRQVGKTTAARQIIEQLGWPHIYASADSPVPHTTDWIHTHWQRARLLADEMPAILTLDEVQKVTNWSEAVKHLWDEDRRTNLPLHVLLLGSSSLLLQEGLTESLSGRFFLYRFPHWSWPEMREAFGLSLKEWLYFGGYPGAAGFFNQEDKWKQYVNDSLIETVLARDVLHSSKISKPALLRQLFGLSTTYPAHILSYNKMLGQLQDAGNTTTLAEYLRALGAAHTVTGLSLFSKGTARKRASSPKLVVLNNALVNAPSIMTYKQASDSPEKWGWLVENAVGAHLLNSLSSSMWNLSYWRLGNSEVDFILQTDTDIYALEVKSGRPAKCHGLADFKKKYPSAKGFLIGESGIPLEEFFSTAPETLLGSKA